VDLEDENEDEDADRWTTRKQKISKKLQNGRLGDGLWSKNLWRQNRLRVAEEGLQDGVVDVWVAHV